jgi:hypothetical protein
MRSALSVDGLADREPEHAFIAPGGARSTGARAVTSALSRVVAGSRAISARIPGAGGTPLMSAAPEREEAQ